MDLNAHRSAAHMLIPLDFKGFFFLHFLIQIIKGSQPFSIETVYHVNLFEGQAGYIRGS